MYFIQYIPICTFSKWGYSYNILTGTVYVYNVVIGYYDSKELLKWHSAALGCTRHCSTWYHCKMYSTNLVQKDHRRAKVALMIQRGDRFITYTYRTPEPAEPLHEPSGLLQRRQSRHISVDINLKSGHVQYSSRLVRVRSVYLNLLVYYSYIPYILFKFV